MYVVTLHHCQRVMPNRICIVYFLGSFVTANENPPCQVLPVTDEPLRGVDTNPPPPIYINKPGQDTYRKPRPLPPNVLYQPIVPYYVLPPSPVSGGSHVYGQGAGHAGFIQGGGPLLPHSPFGASGLLPAPQWFLGLQRDKHLPRRSGSPAGSQRGSVLTRRFDSTSSEMSSEEGSDGD